MSTLAKSISSPPGEHPGGDEYRVWTDKTRLCVEKVGNRNDISMNKGLCRHQNRVFSRVREFRWLRFFLFLHFFIVSSLFFFCVHRSRTVGGGASDVGDETNITIHKRRGSRKPLAFIHRHHEGVVMARGARVAELGPSPSLPRSPSAPSGRAGFCRPHGLDARG